MGATIKIAGAASTANLLNDPAFQAALFAYTNNAITALDITADSSGFLADQIAYGAIAPDIFLPASNQYPLTTVSQANVVVSYVNLLRNSLVLIKNVAAGLPTPIVSFGEVDAAHTVNVPNPAPNTVTVQIYIANPGGNYKVPAGIYAQAAFPSANWTWISTVAQNVTMTSMNNVTTVLNAVANSNNASAIGVVYFTDAMSFDVIGSPIPNPVGIIAVASSAVNATIIYPAAVLNIGPNKGQAVLTQFMNFLQDPAALTYFQKWGFLPY